MRDHRPASRVHQFLLLYDLLCYSFCIISEPTFLSASIVLYISIVQTVASPSLKMESDRSVVQAVFKLAPCCPCYVWASKSIRSDFIVRIMYYAARAHAFNALSSCKILAFSGVRSKESLPESRFFLTMFTHSSFIASMFANASSSCHVSF